MRILIAQINPIVGDLSGNANKIIQAISKAKQSSADLVLFSELVLCGYPPLDLVLLPHFIEEAERQLQRIIQASSSIIAIVGYPRAAPVGSEKFVYNSAAIIDDKRLIGTHDKILLPTYDVFDERRYFESGKDMKTWQLGGKKVAVTICEDIWECSHAVPETRYGRDPIQELQIEAPELILNLSASPYSWKKPEKRLRVCEAAASTLKCSMILCNQVGANDSLIFDGSSFYISKEGNHLMHAKGFEEDFLWIDTSKEIASSPFQTDPLSDLYHALVLGVRDYFHKLGFKKACLGLSGGVDSALVACIACDALGKENVLAVYMPSEYSSDESERDAEQLSKNLRMECRTIPIDSMYQGYLKLLNPHFEGNSKEVTKENIQSRVRAMILMAFSNEQGCLLLTTGNKSEYAMGYCTIYGDMCGSLAVINDLTKTQVYELAKWINREREIIPHYTLTRAPSAELKPNQKDSDTLPEYDILDPILESYVVNSSAPDQIAKDRGFPLDFIQNIAKKVHLNEFKRRQAPPGLRVSEKAFSVGRYFPIVQRWM